MVKKYFMLEELTKTFDNPVNLLEWFSNEPSFPAWPAGRHRVGGQRLGITDNVTPRLQDTLCAMRHALCDSDPNRGLPSVLAETNASGNITAYYVYGLGLISKIEGTSAYYYQYDGLGSTVALTDKTGNLKNQYAYDDFGNLATNSSETITNSFKYVGKFGVITDLPDFLYMRARYYIPSIGRFTQYDPIGALNPYSYVDNNPMKWIDPLGNQSIVIDIERLMIIGVIIAIIYQIRQSGNKFPLPESYPGAGKGKRISECGRGAPTPASPQHNPLPPEPPKSWLAQLLEKISDLLDELM